jgi:hypothetical protein
LLAKDPKKRYQLTFKGLPEKLRNRSVLGEAILYKLEQIGIELEQ